MWAMRKTLPAISPCPPATMTRERSYISAVSFLPSTPDGALTAVPANPRGATWNAGTPAKILEGRYYTGAETGNFTRSYDVSADGQRFLMIKQAAAGGQSASPPQIVVVRNWVEELKRLAPAN